MTCLAGADDDGLHRRDFDELVGNAAFERDADDGAGRGGLDLAGAVDDDLRADGHGAGSLRADGAAVGAENHDVGFGFAAFGDDAKGVRAAGDLKAAVIFGNVTFLAGEIRIGLIGHTDESDVFRLHFFAFLWMFENDAESVGEKFGIGETASRPCGLEVAAVGGAVGANGLVPGNDLRV